jgi:alkanesulfonate monooxygenase SsuD/methylene tetrahydromethanopterin reductase-like flavin-dependent oxidoreductase (luciferase family)
MSANAQADDVRFGVQLPLWDYNVHPEVSFPVIRDTALLAEELGYDFVSLDDHLMRGEGGVFYESWTTVSMLAALTSRVRFQHSVLCNMYRPPALLAKMAATLDAAAGGRYELGIGAGWKREEAEAYGLPWAETKERMDRLEEALQVIRALWTEDVAHFTGRYYTLGGAVCAPKPAQRPHPPIWVGGGGEKRTLRIAARYATGANFAAPGIGSGAGMDVFSYFEHKKGVLFAHCREVGRDPSELTLSAGVNLMLWGRDRDEVRRRLEAAASQRGLSGPERERLLAGMQHAIQSVEQCIDHVRRFIALGARSISVTRASPEAMTRFAEEVIPSL